MDQVIKTHKVVAVCQVYNEIERGNLERFFTYLKPIVDDIVIYDDASSDGSYEYALTQTKHVIRGSKNSFTNEQDHRNQLVQYAQTLKPDFILSIDADEVMSANSKVDLQNWCNKCIEEDVDGVSFRFYNLWRSATYHRTDSFFDDVLPVRLWRVGKGLSYNIKEGLHGKLVPSQIQKTISTDAISVIHYGFSDDRGIAYKYFTYKKHGQSGYLMLDRFIDESKLTYSQVPKEVFPYGLWKKESPLVARSIVESLEAIHPYKERVLRPKYTIVALIYKSVEWLQFSYEQVLKYTDMHDVEFYFVANNAEPHVLTYLEEQHIPHYVYTSTEEEKKQWYINTVYRAWNYGAQMAKGDYVIFVNSDMAYTPNWLDGLIGAYTGKNCVASRLVESGKMHTGQHGIERNFGRSIATYDERAFLEFGHSILGDDLNDGGLYMPLFIHKDTFIRVGGYPEGNVKVGSDIFNPEIAEKEDALISGDAILMQKLATVGIAHQTTWNSVVYHFQEGEMDEKEWSTTTLPKDPIAIVNDLVTGTMGEKVLWDYMIERIPGAYGVDQRTVGKKGFEDAVRAYISENHPDTALVIQNGTFIGLADPSRYTAIFVQDDLRKMGRPSPSQEANLVGAQKVFVNSIQAAASYKEFETEVISVGVNEELFKPRAAKALRKKYDFDENVEIGIFVGAFDEVKGWKSVVACIEANPKTHFICVTKHKADTFDAKNVTVHTRVDQQTLSELLNCANFFILGSPVETQCLAALEAALCDVPILMPLTGIFEDFCEQDRDAVGVFTSDLVAGLKKLRKGTFSPRKKILEKNLTVEFAILEWKRQIARIRLEQRSAQLRGETVLYTKPKVGMTMMFRKVVIKRLIGREYFFPSTMGYALLRVAYKTLVALGLEPLIKKIRG